MPTLAPLSGDSQLRVRAGLTGHAWEVAGPARRPAALSRRRLRVGWLDPALSSVHRRHPLTTDAMPQRR
jgi:hypothetical protein